VTAEQKTAAVARLRVLIAEIWADHRDKHSESYNECEDAECHWCEQTRQALNVLETP
jgi:hypothetical protein